MMLLNMYNCNINYEKHEARTPENYKARYGKPEYHGACVSKIKWIEVAYL